jgi:hypothetical protein
MDKWPDQQFLMEIIYPIIINDNISHISYESLRHSNNDILINACPDNFIGKVIEVNI